MIFFLYIFFGSCNEEESDESSVDGDSKCVRAKQFTSFLSVISYGVTNDGKSLLIVSICNLFYFI